MSIATDPAAPPADREPDDAGAPNQGIPPVEPAEGGDDTPGKLPGSPRE